MRDPLDTEEENAYASRLLDIGTESSETGVEMRFKTGKVPTQKRSNGISQGSLTKRINGDEIVDTNAKAL